MPAAARPTRRLPRSGRSQRPVPATSSRRGGEGRGSPPPPAMLGARRGPCSPGRLLNGCAGWKVLCCGHCRSGPPGSLRTALSSPEASPWTQLSVSAPVAPPGLAVSDSAGGYSSWFSQRTRFRAFAVQEHSSCAEQGGRLPAATRPCCLALRLGWWRQ